MHPPRRTRQRPSYGLDIAWPIVVCVSIHAQAAVLVWNGPASECSAWPRDTPTKKHDTSCAPTRCSYRTNVMNISFLIASSQAARAAFAPFARARLGVHRAGCELTKKTPDVRPGLQVEELSLEEETTLDHPTVSENVRRAIRENPDIIVPFTPSTVSRDAGAFVESRT